MLLLYRIDNIKHIAMTKKANFYAIHGAFYYLLCSVLVILMVSGCTRDVYDPNGGVKINLILLIFPLLLLFS